MYYKIIEEVCREPLYSLKKNGGKTKWKGGNGVEFFQGFVENPIRVLGTGEGCFETLKEYCEIFLAGLPKTS
jgi:hypothetical protein